MFVNQTNQTSHRQTVERVNKTFRLITEEIKASGQINTKKLFSQQLIAFV